jgi:hypothetical protein
MFRNLAAAVTLTTLVALTPAVRADNHEHYLKCAKACDDCARICDMCAIHCSMHVAAGHKDHLLTLRTCLDCATTCRAASSITSRMGPYSDLICQACAEVCKRCGDACAKFPDDEVMKQCAEECRKCEQACRDMLQHLAKGAKK